MAWQDHQPRSPSTQERRGHGLGRKERACAKVMPSPKKRWKVKNINSKAYVSFTPHKLNSHQNVQQNQTNTEVMTNV